MENLLRQVAMGWYRVYWSAMLIVSLVLLGAYIAVHTIPSLQDAGVHFGLTRTALGFAVTFLVYSLGMYRFVRKKNEVAAIFTAAMLFCLMMLHGMTQTAMSVYALPYIGGWLITALFSGMQGASVAVGSPFLVALFLLLYRDFDITSITLFGWLFLLGDIACAAASYLFWRTRYADPQTQQVNQLSGMLRSNRQQSEILIESIADGVIVTNTEGKITLMNSAAASMTEWPLNEASGVDVHLVAKLSREKGEEIPPEENPFTLVLTKRQRINQTLQLTGRDDEKKLTISLVVSPVLLPGASTLAGTVAVIRDVSEQRALEQQRADFISTAAHEMRTPVAAIEGYLALALNEKVSTIDARARGFLEKAHSSTQHLGKLFQDLLTSSKAEDGRLSNHPTVVEMGAFMQQLTDDLKFTAEKKGLFAEFIVGAAEDAIDATAKDAAAQHMVKPLYYVLADPDRMREVVTNLFDNAVKYTEQGKISIGLTGDNDVVQIYVRDTGPGIPAEDIPHLFQKFYRVDNSATRTIGGTGLGLFICRKIVELYKGRIWVESELNKGSTFFINLPRLSTQRASEIQAAEAAPTPGVASNTTGTKA